MGDTTIMKVDSAHSPVGSMGQRHLAMSKNMAMRLWEEDPGEDKPLTARDYETIGYVLQGRAELESEGQTISLSPGDSWVVPKGASHTYNILENFKAIEVTHPPAEVHGRDQ
jgi:quercetin dioxygenase-like cupin family protein